MSKTTPKPAQRKSKMKTENNDNNESSIKNEIENDSNNDNTLFQVVLHRNKSSSSFHPEPSSSLPKNGSFSSLVPLANQQNFFKVNESERTADDEQNHFLRASNKTGNPNYQSNSSLSSLFNRQNEKNSNKSAINVKNMNLRGIFQYEGVSIDLEVTNDSLSYAPINEKYKSRYSSNYKMCEFYSVDPIYARPTNPRKKSTPNANESDLKNDEESKSKTIIGIKLHMFDNIKPNIFKYKSLIFSHPHTETCQEFIKRLTDNIPALQTKKQVLVLINPFSGDKKSRLILNHTVLPILNTAKIEFRLLEFHDKAPLTDLLIENKIKFNDYYGIVIVSGDGSIVKAINAIIDFEIQKNKFQRKIEINDIRKMLNTPFCFIPVGSTNLIASSIYGITDYGSPLKYLIDDLVMRVDMTAVYRQPERLQSFGFNHSCGFGTTLARYFKRYEQVGVMKGGNKVSSSLTKGILKAKHRAIEIEIDYIKSETSQPLEEILCIRNCEVCSRKVIDKVDGRVFDLVEDFSFKKTKSGNSNHIREIDGEFIENKPPLSRKSKNKEESDVKWEKIRGSFIHMSCLSNAAQWDQSSGGGLSKYGHLADGCIDIILVEKVSRKHLYRFVKRHTNAKNQLAYQFVKAIRVKEAKIKILNADDVKSGKKQSKEPLGRTASARIREDFDDGDEDDEEETEDDDDDMNNEQDDNDEQHYRENSMRKSKTSANFIDFNESRIGRENGVFHIKQRDKSKFSFGNQGFLDDLNDDVKDEIEENTHKNRENKSTIKKTQSISDFFKFMDRKKSKKSGNKSKDVEESIDLNKDNSIKRNTPVISTYSVNNNFLNSKSFKNPAVWNCDWNLNNMPEMHIKCIRQFLPVYGAGIDSATEFLSTSVTSCLPKML